MTFLAQFIKLCHLFADVVATVEFALASDDLVILLVLQRFLAERVIADDLSTLGLMAFDFRKSHDYWAV